MKKTSYLFLPLLTLISCQSNTIKEETRFIKSKNNDSITLRVYNCEDYIDEELLTDFESYCKDNYNKDVTVAYSTYDTNEVMLSQVELGVKFDLICSSDYCIQKLLNNDMLTPFDDDSTPNYSANISPFVKDKIDNIKVNGEPKILSNYLRGYFWGTLGILYNDSYTELNKKGRSISPKQIYDDLKDWNNLWDPKYKNLLAIKDSMRDMYAVGIFKSFDDEFKELNNKFLNGSISKEDYNNQFTSIFNRCDDETIYKVQSELQNLKKNAFGFEVDSGKTDMAAGKKFAIDIAWSGDATFAMDLADEDESNSNLRYSLPDTGANIWFDGWFMPKTITSENKIWAQRFVNFISSQENVAKNMSEVGYTSVLASDSILNLIRSWYDIRYDEDSDSLNESILDDYELIEDSELDNVLYDRDGNINLNSSNYYYKKDLSYFFNGTLDENQDSTLCVSLTNKGRQIDTMYPDSKLLPKLAIMDDFKDQNLKIVDMWQNVKNENLPIWLYVLIIVLVLLLITYFIYRTIREKKIKKERIERRKAIAN